jgi:hypothetical protein
MREDPRSAPFAEVVATVQAQVQAQVQLLKEILQGETFLNGSDIVDEIITSFRWAAKSSQ